jgi:UDP-N-acetylglucosamine--N-acetylmuramyl-(pentapeptide) pyrophosphoryl-undecaprenol N-acetylglucosamine transferase
MEPVARAYGAAEVLATVEAFTGDMAQAYAKADFVICAAGAGTLAEISALGLPSLIVPMSSVADDHQAANARAFASRTGASVVREAEWAQSPIADSLARTLQDADTWSRASERMRNAAQLDAVAAIVSACERLLPLRRGDPHEPLTALPRRSARP